MGWVPLNEATDPQRFGGKAANLARAAALGFRVPETLVIERGGASRDDVASGAEQLLRDAPAGLAVRSSAVSEDGERASFAGVFESFVGISTPDEAYDMVLACIAAASSPKALAYMQRMGIEAQDDPMAVILQAVVPAERAGVITTADPDTGDPFTFVCHSTPGLAVDLLSGSGAGDLETFAWDDDGDLATMARELDDAWGMRVDIEWARDSSGLWLLQVRPLTALPEFFPGPRPDGVVRLAQHIVPLRTDLPHGFVTPLYADCSMAEMWARYQPSDIVFTSLWTTERDQNGYRFSSERVERTFIQCFDSVDAYEPWIAANESRYRARWDARFDELHEMRRIATDALEHTTSARDLVEPMLDVRDRLWDLNSFGWSGPQALGWMCEALLCQVVGWGTDVHDVIAAGSDSHTFAVTTALQDLGRSIDEPDVAAAFDTLPLGDVLAAVRGSAFFERYEDFCWRLGKTPSSWRSRSAFWRTYGHDDDDTAMYAIRATYRGESRDARVVQREALAARAGAEEEMRAGIADPSRFDRAVAWARYWTQALNDRHGVSVGLLWERELIWELGSRMVAEGLIAAPEHVLVFRAEDLAAFDVGVYTTRLTEYRRNLRLRAPERLDGAVTAVPEIGHDDTDDDVFRGQGHGSAKATGRARIVRTMDATFLDSVTPGDVLVLPREGAFMYADWHSLLTVVAGVASPGRPSHHLAQVARECGVPLVGHVRGDLSRIPEGATVEVDAASGTVRVL